MSIRLRLAALFTASVLILLGVAGVLFLTELRKDLEKSLTLTLSARADNLETALSGVPRPITTAELRRNRLQHSLNGTYAQILTSDGRIIDTARSVPDQPLITAQQAAEGQHRALVIDRSVTLAGSDNGPEDMRILVRRLRPSSDLLVVAISRDATEQAVASARKQYLWLGLGAVLLAGPGAWLLTSAALRPVERMRREVQALRARSAGTALRVPRTHDEIARLAETFNVLLGELHATLAREKTLVADAGHELRTPLTVLKGELELGRRPQRTREELVRTIDVAAAETDRLVQLTDDLLFLSSEDVNGSRRFPVDEFDLAALAAQAIGTVAPRATERGITLHLRSAGVVQCRGNADFIRRALFNLLTNALRYAPARSSVTVEVGASDGQYRVTVIDGGPGFPPEFLPRAFQRFTRADDSRERGDDGDSPDAATGLGLAIVASIAARHGGSATARNRPEGGAEVSFCWPMAVAEDCSPAGSAAEIEIGGAAGS